MGRAREFDIDEVLEKAKRVFWEKGYEAASIQDLVEATGVNRASLYQAFGGKRELFEQVLERFQKESDSRIAEAVRCGAPGLDCIQAVLELVGDETVRDARGCLIINSVTEMAGCDATLSQTGLAARRKLESFFSRCLREAAARGELPEGKEPRALARFLTNTVMGLRVMSKMQPDRKLVDDVIATALEVLRR